MVVAAWLLRCQFSAMVVLSGTLVGISLVDHFFWSLPQGLWLVVLVLAALISRIPEPTFEGAVRGPAGRS